ncbi:MAG: M23 family metallopeptidase [Paraperlucidibaca sp.]
MMFFASHAARPTSANAEIERFCDLHDSENCPQSTTPQALRWACGALIGLSVLLDFAPSAWAAQTPVITPSIAVAAAAQPKPTLPRVAAINGGLVVLDLSELTSPASEGPLYYQGNPVWVGQLAANGPRVAVIGVGLDTTGMQALTGTPTGAALMSFSVTAGEYLEQRLTIKETKYVSPDPDQLARFSREAAEQKAAYRVFTSAAYNEAKWPSFQWPIVGRLSSPFGFKRFFNDEPRNPHMGIDIAAPKGAIARSPAAGTVALVGDFFFNGRTAIIDHGQGVFSMLCHFDKVLVQAGQKLKAGDPIGEVGATGRATGPHLHWTVSLNDQRIDPRLLLPAAAPAK